MKRKQKFNCTVMAITLGIFWIASGGWCQSSMTINVDGATQVIHKELFGVLMERLGRCVNGGIWVGRTSTVPNTNGMRNDIIEGFKECGVGCIQYPGGCAACSYDWNANKNPSNDLGTDQFMQLCQLTGAEPFIVGKPLSTHAASNMAWVRYINNNPSHPEWTLKYFKVGNEVWGCCGNQNEASYGNNYRPNYDSLKNPVNGKKLFITASTGLTGNMTWFDAAVKNIGSIVDAFEYHDYVFGNEPCCNVPCINFTDNDYWNIMYRTEVSQIVQRSYNGLINILNKYDPDHRIKLVWDEWGNWLQDLGDGWMQQNTVMDALSAAIHINFFMSHADRVQMAGLAQAINVIHSLFLTESAQGRLVKTPTFYVFKMYKPHHTANAKWIPVTASSIQNVTGGGFTMPVLTTAATVNDSGYVNISISNVDLANSRSITINLTKNNVTSYSVSAANIVTGPAKNSYNAFGSAEVVNMQPFAASNYSINGKTLTVTLPKISAVLLTLKPAPNSDILPSKGRYTIADGFSIRSAGEGKVLVTSSVRSKTPVTISLHGIDGRTTITRVSKKFEAGDNTCILENGCTGNGICIVTIKGQEFVLSKQVLIRR